MSSILSGTAKLAGWTLAAAIVASAFVSAPGGGARLEIFRNLFKSTDAPAAAVEPTAPNRAPIAPTAPAPIAFGPEVELEAGAGGNFHTTAEIDGTEVPMVVDTGASMVVLSSDQADRLGFHPLPSDYRLVSQTANGRIQLAQVTLPYVRLGSIEVDNVIAAIAPQGAVGREGLLGMTFLGRLQSYQVSSGRLILKN